MVSGKDVFKAYLEAVGVRGRSGYFGHRGRPGHRGGSAPRGTNPAQRTLPFKDSAEAMNDFWVQDNPDISPFIKRNPQPRLDEILAPPDDSAFGYAPPPPPRFVVRRARLRRGWEVVDRETGDVVTTRPSQRSAQAAARIYTRNGGPPRRSVLQSQDPINLEPPPQSELEGKLQKAAAKFGIHASVQNYGPVIMGWKKIVEDHGLTEDDLLTAVSSGLGGLKDKLGPKGITFFLSGGESRVSFHAEVYGKDGSSMMGISRSFEYDKHGRLVVGHDSLSVSDKEQGGGVTKELFSKLVPLYQKMGASFIDVCANCGVGGYAWAKYGFIPNRASWNHLREYVLKDRLEDIKSQIEPDTYSALRKLLQNPHPESLWAVSDVNVPWYEPPQYGGEEEAKRAAMCNTVGKKLLLGAGWNGVLSLKSPVQMKRLMNYLGKKK